MKAVRSEPVDTGAHRQSAGAAVQLGQSGNGKGGQMQGLRLGVMRVGVFGATGQVGSVMRRLLCLLYTSDAADE